MDNSQKNNKNNIQIKIKSDDVAAGSFSNSFSISFTENEFIIDFIMMQPQVNMGIVTNRIIMTPSKINDLERALREASKAWKNIGVSKNNSGTVQ